MFSWRVEFATDGGRPIYAVDGTSGRDWLALPDSGVVRVILKHGPYLHTLGGMDNYWMCNQRMIYGMFNDPKNRGWYEGPMALAWAWPTFDTHVRIENPEPPPDAHVIKGVMLTDDIARSYGLLGPNDSSPLRPN